MISVRYGASHLPYPNVVKPNQNPATPSPLTMNKKEVSDKLLFGGRARRRLGIAAAAGAALACLGGGVTYVVTNNAPSITCNSEASDSMQTKTLKQAPGPKELLQPDKVLGLCAEFFPGSIAKQTDLKLLDGYPKQCNDTRAYLYQLKETTGVKRLLAITVNGNDTTVHLGERATVDEPVYGHFISPNGDFAVRYKSPPGNDRIYPQIFCSTD